MGVVLFKPPRALLLLVEKGARENWRKKTIPAFTCQCAPRGSSNPVSMDSERSNIEWYLQGLLDIDEIAESIGVKLRTRSLGYTTLWSTYLRAIKIR